MDVKAFKAGEIDLTLEIEARYVVQRPKSHMSKFSNAHFSTHSTRSMCFMTFNCG